MAVELEISNYRQHLSKIGVWRPPATSSNFNGRDGCRRWVCRGTNQEENLL
jgi:hypothetical protein